MFVVLHVDAGVVMAPRLRSRFHRDVERMIKAASLREQRPVLEVAVRLCGDASIRELGRDRGENLPGLLVRTPRDATEGAIEGQIVISFETANRNAKEKMQSLHTELLLLASLGVCVLLGDEISTDERANAVRARASALRYEALRQGPVKPA